MHITLSANEAWILVGVFMCIAYTLQAVTGFGSSVIAMSLSAHFFPMDQLLPILTFQSVLMSTYVCWKERSIIEYRLLGRTILPIMIFGLIIGHYIHPFLNDYFLKFLLGILVLWFSVKQLINSFIEPAPIKPRSNWLTSFLALGAGLFQGLCASGGPILVFAMAGRALNKTAFRATLSIVWVVSNGILCLLYLYDGRLLAQASKIASFLPVLVLSLCVGNYLHHRVNEMHFKTATYLLLLVTGATLILP